MIPKYMWPPNSHVTWNIPEDTLENAVIDRRMPNLESTLNLDRRSLLMGPKIALAFEQLHSSVDSL